MIYHPNIIYEWDSLDVSPQTLASTFNNNDEYFINNGKKTSL